MLTSTASKCQARSEQQFILVDRLYMFLLAIAYFFLPAHAC